MKRQIIMQIDADELDNLIVNELKDSLRLLLKPDRDEGGFEIEPDHETIFGILETIKFFTPFYEIDSYMTSLSEEFDYFKKYTLALDVISTI